MGSKSAHWCAQNAENGLGFVDLLEQYTKDGYEFLSHFVTGNKT
jgi:hypothetical protein